jgi:hypothetical protein
VHLVAVADDFESVAVLDDDLLPDDAVRHRVHDFESFDFALAHADDRAFVTGGLDRVSHAIDPVLRCRRSVGENLRSSEKAAEHQACCGFVCVHMSEHQG